MTECYTVIINLILTAYIDKFRMDSMKQPLILKFSACLIYLPLMSACLEDKNNNSDIDPKACIEPKAFINSEHQSRMASTEDNNDGDLYLSNEQEFLLEDKTYNFTSIYTEEGSTLTLANITSDQNSIITLNTLGSCDIHGDISLDEYTGTLIIKCANQLNMSGSIHLSGGSFILDASSMALTDLKVDVHTDDTVTLNEASITAGTVNFDASLITSTSPSISITPIDSITINPIESANGSTTFTSTTCLVQ